MNITQETDRQAAVDRYDVLDTPSDGTFDNITSIAAALFNVPIAIVSIVDHDRIWFKSHHGFEVDQVERTPGLCASAILTHDPFILTDAKLDPRSLANPLVAGEFGLRFYAAAPLLTSDGFNLGTLCVIDKKPREVTEDQMRMLQSLAAVVVDELELRLAARRVASLSKELHAQTLAQKADAEQRFRQAFDNAPIGMALLSPDLSVLEVNAALCEMFGYRETEVLLMRITELIPPEDVDTCLAAFAKLRSGEVRNYKTEMRWRASGGRLVWSRITLAAVVDLDERPVRFIAQVEEITGRKLQ